MTTGTRARLETSLHDFGIVALAIYTLGVANPHSTALRQSGFYLALLAGIGLVAVRPRCALAVLRQPLALCLAALGAAAALASVVSPLPAYSGWEAYKEFGFLILSAYATALIARRPVDAKLLLGAWVAAAILVSGHDLIQYVREAQAPQWPPADVNKHRYYADPLLWFLPAVLWSFSRVPARALPWVTIAVSLYWLLLVATGARAAWYGGLCAAALWFATYWDGRRIAAVAIALAIAVVAALAVMPPEIVRLQALRGFDTSYRSTGAWLPAIELILQQPWLGYGYGEKVFHEAYNAAVASHPDWFFRTSLGPHNAFLALWFAGGLPLLGALVGVLIAFTAVVARGARAADPAWRAPLVVSACSVLGYLLVRGMFESVGLRVTGLAFGLALAASPCIVGNRARSPDTVSAASFGESVRARPAGADGTGGSAREP